MQNVRQRFRDHGTLQPQTHRCGRKTMLTPKRNILLRTLVKEQPDATLAELGERMDRPFGTSTIALWLRKLGLR